MNCPDVKGVWTRLAAQPVKMKPQLSILLRGPLLAAQIALQCTTRTAKVWLKPR